MGCLSSNKKTDSSNLRPHRSHLLDLVTQGNLRNKPKYLLLGQQISLDRWLSRPTRLSALTRSKHSLVGLYSRRNVNDQSVLAQRSATSRFQMWIRQQVPLPRLRPRKQRLLLSAQLPSRAIQDLKVKTLLFPSSFREPALESVHLPDSLWRWFRNSQGSTTMADSLSSRHNKVTDLRLLDSSLMASNQSCSNLLVRDPHFANRHKCPWIYPELERRHLVSLGHQANRVSLPTRMLMVPSKLLPALPGLPMDQQLPLRIKVLGGKA